MQQNRPLQRSCPSHGQPGNCPSLNFTFFVCSPSMPRVDNQRENGALLIAACIIAVIRLRGESIERLPKVVATISDSVRLAKLVWMELER